MTDIHALGHSFPRREELLSHEIVVRDFPSITSISRHLWDRMLPGEPESWDFYAAVEKSPPPGFKLGVLVAFAGGALVGVAPLFRSIYRIDTPLQGRLRQVGDWLHSRLPRLLGFPVIGIGSPMSDNCALGFAPELSSDCCVRVFNAMLRELAAQARADKSVLLAVKSLDRSAEVLDRVLDRSGYHRVTSVPLAMLDLPYLSLHEYLATLPEKTSSYLRRKMRGADKVRIEWRTSMDGLAGPIRELFENTLRQSRVNYGDFQRLGDDYFCAVAREMGDKALLMLCWGGDELLSFQLALIGRDRLLAKQIGMKYPEARELNLYFVNWLKLIEYAIDHRIPCIEMGATTYATKLLFGGYLERRWLHFRFRRSVSNLAFGPLGSRFLDFEQHDPELVALEPVKKSVMGPRLSRIELRSTGEHDG